MNRRGFLAGLGALIGGIAIEQAVPFGRVWSFPKVIKPYRPSVIPFRHAGIDIAFSPEDLILNIDDFTKRYIRPAMRELIESQHAFDA